MAFSKVDSNTLARVLRTMRDVAAEKDGLVTRAIASGDRTLVKQARADAGRIHRDVRELSDLKDRLDGALEAGPGYVATADA